jgi:hypothetical protein
MIELRGRAALAVGAASDSEAHLREAERSASEIEAEQTTWAAPLAKVLRAGAAVVRQDPRQAAALLVDAEREFMGQRMALHVAVARLRRASIAAPDESRLIHAAATTWMQEQSIADFERMAQTIAPWKRDADGRPRAAISGSD